jgi:hypothetical protein
VLEIGGRTGIGGGRRGLTAKAIYAKARGVSREDFMMMVVVSVLGNE